MRLSMWTPALLILTVGAGVSAKPSARPRVARPFFSVPTLTEIRDILAQLEAPIVSTLVQRVSLPVDPSLYAVGSAAGMMPFMTVREQAANRLGRYEYGTLEYPFTLPGPAADLAGAEDAFPPGRFHQDTFSGNANITAFYRETLIPLLNASATPFFYHLSNTSSSSTPDAQDTDAALGVDAALLGLLSHRAHIGKIVAESKFAENATLYAGLIKAQDTDAIRTLLTNTTQETQVLEQADAAASALCTAWTGAGEIVPAGFEAGVRVATQKVFRELIDITTEIEIQYLLERL